MIRNLIVIFCALLSAIIVPEASADTKSAELRLVYEVPDRTIYEHEAVPVVLTLVSSTPDIAFASKNADFILEKGSFETIKKIEPLGKAYRKKIDGKVMYCFPLEAYLVSFNTKGTYTLSPRTFSVGVNYPVIVNNPFWGRVRSSETVTSEIKVEKCRFNVKALPNPPKGFNFSGAVGEFSIETFVPKGNIYVNEEAIAYVIVKGKGMIAQSTLPHYRDAFENNIKLKSAQESRSETFENGSLVSEIAMECTFIPEVSGEITIGTVSFDYFNPISGKYETATSKPVTFQVKSSVKKRESIEI